MSIPVVTFGDCRNLSNLSNSLDCSSVHGGTSPNLTCGTLFTNCNNYVLEEIHLWNFSGTTLAHNFFDANGNPQTSPPTPTFTATVNAGKGPVYNFWVIELN